MEIQCFAFVAPRKTYVLLIFPSAMAADSNLLQRALGRAYSGLLLSNTVKLNLLVHRVSSMIIQDVFALRADELVSMAYFYFDFRDINKQNRRDLLLSLVTQLSDQSHRHCDILNDFYLNHGSGAEQPSEDGLMQCLKDTLTIPDQPPVYLIIDALDECLDTFGLPSPREKVLDLVRELVEFSPLNLRLCVTSRPEVDIRRAPNF